VRLAGQELFGHQKLRGEGIGQILSFSIIPYPYGKMHALDTLYDLRPPSIFTNFPSRVLNPNYGSW